MNPYLFAYLSIAIISMSLLVVTRKNPIHCVLCMLILFFHIAVLFVTLNAEFLAVVQLIVYAGAVLVLFVFAMMVLNLKEEIEQETYVSSWPMAVAAAFGFFIVMFFYLQDVRTGPPGIHTPEHITSVTHTRAIGIEIFTNYILPFEIASFILLIAVIGAIVLAKRTSRD